MPASWLHPAGRGRIEKSDDDNSDCKTSNERATRLRTASVPDDRR